jgi:hypothetical protein
MSARSKPAAKTAKSYDYHKAMSLSSPRTSSPFLTHPSAYTSEPFTTHPYSPTASPFYHPNTTASCVPTAAMCDYPFASTSQPPCYGNDDSYDDYRTHRSVGSKSRSNASMYGGGGHPYNTTASDMMSGHPYNPTASDMMSGHPYDPTASDMMSGHPYDPTASDMMSGHPYYDSTSANMMGGHPYYDPTSANMMSDHPYYGATAADMYGHYDPTASDPFGHYRGTSTYPNTSTYNPTALNFFPSREFLGRTFLPGFYAEDGPNTTTNLYNRLIGDGMKAAAAAAYVSMSIME